MTALKKFSAYLSSERTDFLRAFFTGRVYPAVVMLLVALSHIFGLEIYLGLISIALVSLALLVCDTARPAIPFVVSFVFQLSLKNAPGIPTYSDYLFTGARLVFVVIFGALLFSSAVIFSVRNRIFSGMNFKNTRMLLPLLILSLGFLFNGVFSSGFSFPSFLYGLMQSLCYTLIFLFFSKGLKREKAEEISEYFTYVSAILALTLLVELFALYLTGAVISDGSIVKENLLFGWGIWNTAGVSLAVLIPVIFLGVLKGKNPLFYLCVTILTALGIVFTMSRNALLFGAAVTFICFLLGCIRGENRKLCRYTLTFALICIAFAAIFFADEIRTVFNDFINRGFSDNGRFELWREGFKSFLCAPVFGSGFFDFSSDLTFDVAAFLPKMAHNTFIQILSCMGVFGLLCYLFYRYKSLEPFWKKPNLSKTMLLLSVLVMLGESLLDNFVFYFLPTLHYSVSLAVAERFYEEEQNI